MRSGELQQSCVRCVVGRNWFKFCAESADFDAAQHPCWAGVSIGIIDKQPTRRPTATNRYVYQVKMPAWTSSSSSQRHPSSSVDLDTSSQHLSRHPSLELQLPQTHTHTQAAPPRSSASSTKCSAAAAAGSTTTATRTSSTSTARPTTRATPRYTARTTTSVRLPASLPLPTPSSFPSSYLSPLRFIVTSLFPPTSPSRFHPSTHSSLFHAPPPPPPSRSPSPTTAYTYLP